MRFDLVTICPEYFGSVFEYGIVRRAVAAKLVDIEVHDLRRWATGKHRTVDDRPFGGGDGMVFKPEPIYAAVEELTGANDEREGAPSTTPRVILMSPQGRVLTQAVAAELAGDAKRLIVVCGRYEGVDERVVRHLVTDEISIGDYVLSGGEPAAAVLIDAVVRLIPGALGSETSAEHDSFSRGLLDFPHYTRPPEFRGMRVPEVLLGGNHAEIEMWRRREALRKTWQRRPELLDKVDFSLIERQWLEEFTREQSSGQS
ncbi:MAG TPA: tRNA (guanosine(37)-N1)-methyltransferase TrmD [Pyrinomonadaceae bacterium]|jgi:tRNA (guanine37-N1)-methyltransferase|nr:tRNA (guanosine(37)-N1)-methyltransferase TrmD [Pyrinomonadaceae bacterium]